LIQRVLALLSAVRAAQSGQGLVEYAAMLGFVAAVMVVAILWLEPNIANTLNNVANSF
jgi:Flp pilus assembly pilin Flp